jgi:hypothetical protein
MKAARRSGGLAAAIVAACATGVALSACGGGGGEAGASGASQREKLEEAGLKFAQCMREKGIDVPDPKPGGGIVMRFERGQGGVNPESPAFREAQEECGKHLEDARPELTEEQKTEFRDAALKFAQCMREHGVNMPDPTFGSNGEVQMRVGGPDAGPREDPKFQEAAEECQKNLPEGGPLGVGPGPK